MAKPFFEKAPEGKQYNVLALSLQCDGRTFRKGDVIFESNMKGDSHIAEWISNNFISEIVEPIPVEPTEDVAKKVAKVKQTDPPTPTL